MGEMGLNVFTKNSSWKNQSSSGRMAVEILQEMGVNVLEMGHNVLMNIKLHFLKKPDNLSF